MRCSRYYEGRAQRAGACRVAGVDEVGRGALFGPVVAAAVILDPARRLAGLNDSKLLTPEERAALAPRIRGVAQAWAIAAVDAGQIDAINIYQASRRAMSQAVGALSPAPDYLLVDAMALDWGGKQLALPHGDGRSASIAAASILAKVYRDALMCQWHAIFPDYGLMANKGYGTPHHLAALRRFGVTPLHRRSYAPVAEFLVS
ncbi:MAG: ribonuclease HII [Terriglobales bacterium]